MDYLVGTVHGSGNAKMNELTDQQMNKELTNQQINPSWKYSTKNQMCREFHRRTK